MKGIDRGFLYTLAGCTALFVVFLIVDDIKFVFGFAFAIAIHRLMELRLERQRWKKIRRGLMDYLEHKRDCILSFWEAGEPTPDGGYRTKYKGQWYQSRPIDETPKCDCGLDQALAKWREEK